MYKNNVFEHLQLTRIIKIYVAFLHAAPTNTCMNDETFLNVSLTELIKTNRQC